MDTQGVSRDEAMSSGLVPVTNAAGAILEFLDEECGFAVSLESYQEIANSISFIYENPGKYLTMSKKSSERVTANLNKFKIIDKEISFFKG